MAILQLIYKFSEDDSEQITDKPLAKQMVSVTEVVHAILIYNINKSGLSIESQVPHSASRLGYTKHHLLSPYHYTLFSVCKIMCNFPYAIVKQLFNIISP